VNGRDTKAELFDVFLCHNGEDKPAVREIAQMLVKAGIKPWLDEEQIRPGTSWQKALGEQIESIKSAAVFVGKNGIAPWQDEEIQALLSEFMRQNCPLIPTVLADAINTPELPWTLRNRHWVDFRAAEPDPLKQLIWGITGAKPIVKESLIPGKEDNTAPRIRFSESRYYPPLARAPDQEQAIQLNILRKRVMEYWVDGVLKHSLYNEVLISLGKREVGNAVDAPWKYTVEVAGATDATPLDDRDASAIYDATGLLLILGEPGSGKTTTLLDVARTLLDRAGDDIKERVAVVLNLSSWKKKEPIVDLERTFGEVPGAQKNWSFVAPAWLSTAAFGWTGRGRNREATGLRRCDQYVYRKVSAVRPRGLLSDERVPLAPQTAETERSYWHRAFKL
jgi:TIR domain